MTTLQEIEAALPKLSAEELAQVEALIQSVRREREEDANAASEPDPAITEPSQRPKRKMVLSPYGNDLWVLEATPGVVVTSEMIRRIQDEDDEVELQESIARCRPSQSGKIPGEGEA